MTTHNQPTPGDGAPAPSGSLASRLLTPARVIIVSSVMFTFISYWRTAAVVLCDLASTSYYIGGIVEQSIGPAAPWFILGVMFFSYAVRWVYIESCTLFLRGGVYRVVREALGKFMAKLAVSALMFDYILTGPISGVTAGQYVLGLVRDGYIYFSGITDALAIAAIRTNFTPYKNWGSVLIAVLVTLYFFRRNLRGIHESSDDALKIMIITTIMGVIMLTWCGITVATKAAHGEKIPIPSPEPRLTPRPNYNLDPPEDQDPLGFIKESETAKQLRGTEQVVEGNKTYQLGSDFKWMSLIGLLGLSIAFGHSILAMSGEETLAQVYREVESPKLPNFKKAAFIVFIYSLVLTGGISFLAVVLIPDNVRMSEYGDNLIGGLAMFVIGPEWARLALRAFVVVVGFLILSGAVNTAIIGSNGVLNRVAEDGVMPDWFLKPHKRFGTTSRILWLIIGLQIVTIVLSRGDVFLLGEAYAFGVVWSFVFQALAMVVLRFTDRRPRQFKVPFNIKVGGVEFPVGLVIILLILLGSAVTNFLTKEIATIGGVTFTLAFFTLFAISEHYHRKRTHGGDHKHLEQFNQQTTGAVTVAGLGLTRPYRKLVAIRSTQNLFMLEKALAETDPDMTDVVVMTAKYIPPGGDSASENETDLDTYDQQLMTAVVDRAEKAGKQVKPLIVPTNNPLHAILTTARDLQVHELVLGASNKYTADEQLEQLAFYWINLHGGSPAPLTVRMLTRERDMSMDLGGGNRIPKISERKARNVAELRAAGVGVSRVMLIHDGTAAQSDLFLAVMTMLDPEVHLALVPVAAPGEETLAGQGAIYHDGERARQLGRELVVLSLPEANGPAIVREAAEGQYDLIILPLSAEGTAQSIGKLDERTRHIIANAHCRVFLAAAPGIPTEVMDKR